MNKLYLSIACIAIGLASQAWARNVDLSTVPQRNTVQLTIYNSEDLTLVRETRTISFKKGINPLQFSWANTLIDPTSVQLKFLTQPDKLEVLDTTFPHDKPQQLYWNIQSELDGQATVQITYFTSGITWSADYTLISDSQETQGQLEGFVRIYNNSGEEYEDAQVRLVVGKINLVEKIAQLARIPMAQVPDMPGGPRREYQRRGLEDSISKAEEGAGGGGGMDRKQVIKEGLSEYFIFTIEGTETIPNGWSKRLRAIEAEQVPLKIQYRYRPRQYGDQLVRMYLLTNDEKSKLGQSPLPDGVVRVFRQNGRRGLSYLVQHTIQYIPIGDKIELNLGPDPSVHFELVKLKSYRDNIWVQWNNGRLVQRVGDGAVKIDLDATVVGWDEHSVCSQRIRNYTSKPIEVEVRRSYDGDVVFRAELPDLKLHDYQTLQYTVVVPAGVRGEFVHEVIQRHGRNAKQNRVTLEEKAVEFEGLKSTTQPATTQAAK